MIVILSESYLKFDSLPRKQQIELVTLKTVISILKVTVSVLGLTEIQLSVTSVY